jgi:hypothetical protein
MDSLFRRNARETLGAWVPRNQPHSFCSMSVHRTWAPAAHAQCPHGVRLPCSTPHSATELVADQPSNRALDGGQQQHVDLNKNNGLAAWWMEQLMCRDVRHVFNASVVRINSWDYFLPLLQANPHHADALEELGDDLAGILTRFLLRPIASPLPTSALPVRDTCTVQRTRSHIGKVRWRTESQATLRLLCG